MQKKGIPQPKLALAYFEWRKKKNLRNLSKMLEVGFKRTRFNLLWRIWRVLKNTVTGKYERLYQEYWKDYDK